METCYTKVMKLYARRSKQKELKRKHAVHAQMSKIHYIKMLLPKKFPIC